MSRRTGPSREVREAVMKRDKWRCVRCGRDVTSYGANFQHRKPRGMGGTRDASINKPSNGIVLCGSGTTGCHGWVETHRAESHEAGWSIPWWQDPLEVPVLYPDGNKYLLDDEGGRKRC